MNLQEQIINELSEQMCSQVDFEILTDVLVNSCGWYRVELERFENNRHAIDVVTWCREKIRGEWKRNGCKFIFEEQKDAVNFIFKWR